MPDHHASEWFALLEQCMFKDRHYFRRQITRELSKKREHRNHSGLLEKMMSSVQKSKRRMSFIPKILWDDSLPVAGKKQAIHDLLVKHQVVIVAGETGSGKTTQLPKICLEAGRGVYGMIGHTQPRRLAARAVATRIAEELNVEMGEQVGYQVRFSDQCGDNTLIKLMTDGILLAEIKQDPYLKRYDTIIVDEAHERSLNIDFLLGYLKRLLPERPDLKVIVTSATIDVERFSTHFNHAPVIEVSGRMFPVETVYHPLDINKTEGRDKDELMQNGVISALAEIEKMENHGKLRGDVLVFLSGEREIRELSKRFRDEKPAHATILPLYARLSPAEQQRIFHPSGQGRRVILATNVAETSLTVPGIGYVIDAGFARISRYSPHSRVQRLPVEPVSQASANQRKGRCGRIAEGVCFRLYSEEDFNSRAPFTDPEILRTSLASVILQMLFLRLGEISSFPFIDMPESKAINDGFTLLAELGAISQKKQLTPLGKQLASLPVDPRMGRMIIEARETGALNEVLIIVSALSIQDPRERPAEKRQVADESHREFVDKQSDFLSLVNLWNWFETQREALTQNQLRKLCKERFIHFLRMREWRDMHRQILLVCKTMNMVPNIEPASYESIHKALLAGLVTHVGLRHDEADYQGVRNRKFWIVPNSELYGKKPKWCMASELVETSRLYARVVAGIQPQWIEPLARTLVRKSYLDPHWEKKRSQVVAKEQVLLYGLMIGSRKIHYGPLDPVESRQIFIREALVQGDFSTKLAFFHENGKTIARLEDLENRIRKRDILVDDEQIFKFYDERIPEQVYSGSTLEKWIKSDNQAEKHLRLTEACLRRREDDHSTSAYPETMAVNGVNLPLTYVFEPGANNDGITISIPLALLSTFPEHRAEWLTPGLLHEKIAALIRSLPKSLRKHFIPASHFASAVAEAMTPCNEPLLPLLSEKLFRMTGVKVPDDQWQIHQLDNHLKMNFRLVDEEGNTLAESREVETLRKRFADRAKETFSSLSDSRWEQEGMTTWSFEELPESVEVKKAGMTFQSFPALVDAGDSVSLQLFDSLAAAKLHSRYGLARLIMFQLGQSLKTSIRSLRQLDKISMLTANTISKKQLVDTLPFAIINNVYLDTGLSWPVDSQSFELYVQNGKSKIDSAARAIEQLLIDIFTHFHGLMKILKKQTSFQVAFSMSDIKAQLQALVYSDFLKETPWQWLSEYPRYLQAVEIRIQKMAGQERKDQVMTQELQEQWKRWQERKQHFTEQNRHDTSLELYRWMLEEYRVSLFAQSLKTKVPVSAKRLDKLWKMIPS